MKASRVYRYRVNKNFHYKSVINFDPGNRIFWDSLKDGPYRRGMKDFLKKFNPFNRLK